MILVQNGQTALMKCSFSGRVQVVEELVKNGALLDLRCTVCVNSLYISLLLALFDEAYYLLNFMYLL